MDLEEFIFVIGRNFCIFSKKNLLKNLHKFQKTSEFWLKIFASRGKKFVCLEIDKEYLIKT